MTFRLNEQARSILTRISLERNLTATAVVELALRQLQESETAKEARQPIDTPVAAKTEQPETRSIIPAPVQDISATKKVVRRKINPMTGKPFGPVPK